MTRQGLKLALSIVGLALTAAALRYNDPRLTWAAIAFLAAAVLVRFIGGRATPS